MPRVYVDSNLIAELCRRHAIREMALFGSATREDLVAQDARALCPGYPLPTGRTTGRAIPNGPSRQF